MRSLFTFLFILLFCQVLSAQEAADTLRGRIVNAAGKPVEYVHIGIPSQKIGAISSRDGQFELIVPRGKAGTVEFHHVSYETYYLPVSEFSKNLTIALSNQELTPAIAHSGRVREKYLIKRGVALLSEKASVAGVFLPQEQSKQREDSKSGELGSVANVKHPFRVEEIAFPMMENSIPGCVISFNIYKVSDKDTVFENILTKPCVYCGDTYRVGCDRIDNSKGHTKDNVVPCCIECNTARNNYFTYEEMKRLGRTIAEIKKERRTKNG